MRRAGLGLTAALLAGAPARAYVAGNSWADGNIVMHLQLSAPAGPLLDGAADWGSVAESALAEWNTQITRSRLTFVRDSAAAKSGSNRINNVFFNSSVYGDAFGDDVLAVTTIRYTTSTGRMVETDVLFNSNLTWNSYRGTLRGTTRDFRRVALHEFGHVLGLDHPDTARPPQFVSAIMNSRVSNTETLRDDDIAGAKWLYDPAGVNTLAISTQPQSGNLLTGDSYTLNVAATGSGPFTYEWYFQAPGQDEPERFSLATGAMYTIGSVQPADIGSYYALVTKGGTVVKSSIAALNVRPLTVNTDTMLANISTRGVVGTGNGVLIAGLIIGGSTEKTVLVRAAGPALAGFGVSGALANPTLSIVNAQGQVVAQNDDWGSGGNATAINAASTRVGAFQFGSGSRDAALLATLPSGNYSAVVSGVSGTTGVALVEAYDADADTSTSRSRRLLNISTRGFVGSGENVLIAGLVVTGPGPRTFLIRAVGPTLARAPFNLRETLSDPFLQIYRGETLLRENDDWDAPSSGQAALRAAAAKVGAFEIEDRDPVTGAGIDSAMLITLQPGSYTAKVSGFDGATGIALVEIYEVP